MATAEQTESAVLEATNKAYIVETGDSEDGLSHYRRWSDGTIEQWGVTPKASSEPTTITFPVAFSDTKYSFVFMVDESYVSSSSWMGIQSEEKTTTSIAVRIQGGNESNATNYAWQAIGK